MNLEELLSSKAIDVKKTLAKLYFLNILIENFKRNLNVLLLDFYGATYSYDEVNDDYEYHFYIENPNNDRSLLEGDFIEDESSKKEFEDAVYNKCGKDTTKSLYKWFLTRNYIDNDDYENLLSIRKFRNKIIHEFDKKEDGDIPDVEPQIKLLFKIRKKLIKNWINEVEISAIPDPTEDDLTILQKMYSDEYWIKLYDKICN